MTWKRLNSRRTTITSNSMIGLLVTALLLMVLPGFSLGEPVMDPVIDYEVKLQLDIEDHRMHTSVILVVPAGIDTLWLNGAVDILSATFSTGTDSPGSSSTEANFVHDGEYHVLDTGVLLSAAQTLELKVEYSGRFNQSVEDVTFSRENVGGEIEATVSDEGVYFSSGACWLPTCWQGLATYSIEVTSPLGWEVVTQGKRVARQQVEDTLVTAWLTVHPSDGINLIVNRFHVAQQMVGASGDIIAYTFLLDDDTRLRDLYLERTGAYIDMYEQMIGPYPYAKFATVENWFPTGYGMPSYTLLGGVVLRLPFIPYTSFGHEICHNWWGNSVFVESSEGNWCEGLTSYCADYHYKQLESPAAAREYRRNLLKDYVAYVKDPTRDFPLAEFMSRHSGATRAVGYGKSMMVFHMIDQMIGRESFLAGIQSVYRDFSFRRAAWSDFLEAFSRAAGPDSGFDSGRITKEWLERKGAPILALSDVKRDDDRVRFKLAQAGEQLYTLQIPIVIDTPEGPVAANVKLDRDRDNYEIAASGATRLAIDPDFHVFRRLDRKEIEPTISQVLAEDIPLFIVPSDDPQQLAAAREFAGTFAESDAPEMFEGGSSPTGLQTGSMPSNVVINPEGELLKKYIPAEMKLVGNYVFNDGRRFDLKEFDLVFATINPHDEMATDLVIICRSPERLPSLASRVGHYGKYSWLLLPAGSGRTLRGNWTPATQPLVADLGD